MEEVCHGNFQEDSRGDMLWSEVCVYFYIIYIYILYTLYIHEYWPRDQVFAPDPLLYYAQCRSTFHIDFAVLARAQVIGMI